MKKILILIIISLIIFSNEIILKAECNDELVNLAKPAMFATSMAKKNEEGDPYFHIVFGPIYSFIYAKAINIENKETLIFDENNTENAVGYIDISNFYKVSTFKIEFYTNLEECKDNLIRTIEISTPKFNKYSVLDVCRDNWDFKMCHEFYDTANISKKEFLEKLNEYTANKNKTDLQKFYGFIKEYYLYFTIPTVIIGGINVYKILGIKRSRKR